MVTPRWGDDGGEVADVGGDVGGGFGQGRGTSGAMSVEDAGKVEGRRRRCRWRMRARSGTSAARSVEDAGKVGDIGGDVSGGCGQGRGTSGAMSGAGAV